MSTIYNYTADVSHAESGQQRPLSVLEQRQRLDVWTASFSVHMHLQVYRPPLSLSPL